MSFNTNTGRAEYVASAGQTEFAYVFKTYNTSDLTVYLTPDGNTPDDTADLLTETTHYTVTQNGDLGGTVTLLSAASVDDTVVIVRNLPINRTTDYQQGGDLLESTLDEDQNYQTYLAQQNAQDQDRFIKVSDTTVNFNATLPSADVGYLKFKDDGTGLELDTTVATSVADAAASAAAALVSETNAASSAASALASKTGVDTRLNTVQSNTNTVEENLDIITSEPIASQLAAAETNATNAANAAANATTSATNASTSATAAQTAQTAAEQSATDAAASAALAASYTPNPFPVTLGGVITGQEETVVVITDSSYDANATYLAEVNFGSVVDNADGTYTVTLPEYTVATGVVLTVTGAKLGYDDNADTHGIAVTNTQVATPILSSAGTGSEETTVVVTDSADEADATYFPSVDFGSVVDNGGGSYTVTLPAFGVATGNIVTFSLYGTRAGDIDSPTVTETITVTEVTFVADTAVTDDMSVDVINDGF